MTDDAQSDKTTEQTIYDMIFDGLTYHFGKRNVQKYEGKLIVVKLDGETVDVQCYDNMAVARCLMKGDDGNYMVFKADEIQKYVLELARLANAQPSIYSPDGEYYYVQYSLLIDYQSVSQYELASAIEYVAKMAWYSSIFWSIRKSMESEDGDVAESIDPAIESEND